MVWRRLGSEGDLWATERWMATVAMSHANKKLTMAVRVVVNKMSHYMEA